MIFLQVEINKQHITLYIKNNVDDLKEQKEFYISEIKSDSTELFKLKNDSEEQEKFAREKFLMKKDNENIFIIRENEDD